MSRLFTLQTCGSVLVVLAFIASELSARALSAFPGSPWAWYVRLEVFPPFEAARADGSPVSSFFGPGSLPVALLVLLLLLAMRAARFRFGIALGANLAFLFAGFVAQAWLDEPVRTASLLPSEVGRRPDGLLVVGVLGASFLAFVLSHVGFVAAILDRGPPRRASSGFRFGGGASPPAFYGIVSPCGGRSAALNIRPDASAGRLRRGREE